ncbi:MAG: tail fiber protein [Leptospiraceae bacterium]|nr:tail fiber protein [Leptospiraceae bacterium]
MTLAQQIANRIKIKLNLMTTQINSLSSGTGNVPVGATLEYAGTVLPTGFLFCDGAAVSRTTYANLFTALGISHGQGDGVNTFNLPDYRGVFLRGVDGGAGRDPDASSRTALQAGGNTGDAVGSYQEDALELHKHGSCPYPYPGSGLRSIAPADNVDTSNPSDSYPTSNQVTGKSATETRGKNVSVNRIIKF